MSPHVTVTDAQGVRGRLLTAMPSGARAGTVAIALDDGRHIVAPHERLIVEEDGADYRLDGQFSDFEVIDAAEAAPPPESNARTEAHFRRDSDPGPASDLGSDTSPKTMTLAHEEVEVGRRQRPIGRVRIDKTVETEEVELDEHIDVDEVDVERVPIGQVIDEPPEVRREGDTLVIPVVEERLVKQLVLVEEVRVQRRRRTEDVDIPVTLRREQVDISRTRLDSSDEHGQDRPSR